MLPDDRLNVSVCDGKYTVVQRGSGALEIYRNGERWINDPPLANMILALAQEVAVLRALRSEEEAEPAAWMIEVLDDQGNVIDGLAHFPRFVPASEGKPGHGKGFRVSPLYRQFTALRAAAPGSDEIRGALERILYAHDPDFRHDHDAAIQHGHDVLNHRVRTARNAVRR